MFKKHSIYYPDNDQKRKIFKAIKFLLGRVVDNKNTNSIKDIENVQHACSILINGTESNYEIDGFLYDYTRYVDNLKYSKHDIVYVSIHKIDATKSDILRELYVEVSKKINKMLYKETKISTLSIDYIDKLFKKITDFIGTYTTYYYKDLDKFYNIFPEIIDIFPIIIESGQNNIVKEFVASVMKLFNRIYSNYLTIHDIYDSVLKRLRELADFIIKSEHTDKVLLINSLQTHQSNLKDIGSVFHTKINEISNKFSVLNTKLTEFEENRKKNKSTVSMKLLIGENNKKIHDLGINVSSFSLLIEYNEAHINKLLQNLTSLDAKQAS
jgi:hypothetical protein